MLVRVNEDVLVNTRHVVSVALRDPDGELWLDFRLCRDKISSGLIAKFDSEEQRQAAIERLTSSSGDS